MSSLNLSQKEIGQNKVQKRLPRINNSLINLKSLSLLCPSQDITTLIGNNLNESSNVQPSKGIKSDNAFNNFVFQDNFTKKKITYADLKSDANQRLAQSSNNISRSIHSLNEGANQSSFLLNNISQNISSINNNPIQSVSKLNLSAINPKANSQFIDFQREIKNSIQQFSDYAVVLKSSEQQVKNLVKQQLQKHETEFNSKQPNFNSKRLNYIDAQRNILKIEKSSLHSLLNNDNFQFDPKLHKMNFVTLCQMSPDDRSKIESYFEQSLKQDPLLNSNRKDQNIKNDYHSYSELVSSDLERQGENVQPEESQLPNAPPKKKKKMFNFSDNIDPFRPKKILKSFTKKKKIFDLFQEETHELTFANKLDLLKDNLKENIILKLKQQYGVKNSHLIVPPLDYLSFKDLDVDRNIIIYKYLEDFKKSQESQLQQNQNTQIESNEGNKFLKLPSIYQSQQGLNTFEQIEQVQADKEKLNSMKLIKNINISSDSQAKEKKEEGQTNQKINNLPEGQVLKPFYEMTNYRTDEEVIQAQKQQLENLKKRFKNKQITEEEELFCRRLEENDLIEIEFLLNRNPDLINTIDKEGDGILHIASRKCNLKVIKFLLSQGANLHSLNTSMKTPIEVCKLIKRDKLKNFFENYLEEVQLQKQKNLRSSSQIIANNSSQIQEQSASQKKNQNTIIDKELEYYKSNDQKSGKQVHFTESSQDNQN